MDVCEAANLLDCGEWKIFELAFVEFYGDYNQAEVEVAYSDYFRNGTIPMWVNHYLRRLERVVL